MNTCGMTSRLAVLAAISLAAGASAQTEQWLQYHSSGEGRGYRWLDLSTNAPAGVALPKLTGQAFYTRWTTPLDPQGGRWMCFDRSKKSGPHNRLFIDRNGDGRLDDEKPLDASATDAYSATFEPAKLVFKGEDGPLTYHLGLRFMHYGDNDSRLLASPGCSYSGKVAFGTKKLGITLFDGNVNGTFNDRMPNPTEGDGVIVDGDKAGGRYLGSFLEVGDQLFDFEVARDGAFVKVKPAQGVTLGRVRVPEAISEVVAVGAPGHFVRKPAKGEFNLPAGKYQVNSWTLNRKDEKGVAWKLIGSGAGSASAFEVVADKPVTLAIGEPIVAALTAVDNKGIVAFSLKLKGSLGETVEIQRGGQRDRPPRLLLASVGGTFRATNSFEFG